MRGSVLSALALSLVASAGATAADLPRRAAAPAPFVAPAPLFTWTGFYVGGQVGYGWGRQNSSIVFPAFAGLPSISSTGVLGGVHAGYNQQYGNSLVAGLEGDIEAAGLKGSASAGPGAVIRSRSNFKASIRARGGLAVDRALFYVTGGVAFSNLQARFDIFPGTQTVSTTRAGWTLGGGVEYVIAGNWSARLEYRYADYGRYNVTPAIVAPGLVVRERYTENAVRAGLSYRFGPTGGAVLARY